MSLTRRQILAGSAATAACAAMPAAVIAERGFDVDRFINVAVAETERLHPHLMQRYQLRMLEAMTSNPMPVPPMSVRVAYTLLPEAAKREST